MSTPESVQDKIAKRKEEYRAAKLKKPEPPKVQVSKCKACGMMMGQPGATLRYVPAQTKEGKLVRVPVHVGCPKVRV